VQQMVELGTVATCAVLACSYNNHNGCMARGIVVGDVHPRCDTYTHDPVEPSRSEADVVSCLSEACTYNAAHLCAASGVTVGVHEGHADCLTFRPR
jgi:hypothetical protein